MAYFEADGKRYLPFGQGSGAEARAQRCHSQSVDYQSLRSAVPWHSGV